jgi:hypothetical protein
MDFGRPFGKKVWLMAAESMHVLDRTPADFDIPWPEPGE